MGTQSYVLSEIIKIDQIFQLKIVIFTPVKNRCMMHGRVFEKTGQTGWMSKQSEYWIGTKSKSLDLSDRSLYMSHLVRKPVLGVSDQVRQSLGCRHRRLQEA